MCGRTVFIIIVKEQIGATQVECEVLDAAKVNIRFHMSKSILQIVQLVLDTFPNRILVEVREFERECRFIIQIGAMHLWRVIGSKVDLTTQNLA